MKKMRRSKQALSNEKCIEILNKNTSGVLALCGNQMEPYALPISYVYENHKIYFHCAKSGYKLDLIQENNQVSFCERKLAAILQENQWPQVIVPYRQQIHTIIIKINSNETGVNVGNLLENTKNRF